MNSNDDAGDAQRGRRPAVIVARGSACWDPGVLMERKGVERKLAPRVRDLVPLVACLPSGGAVCASGRANCVGASGVVRVVCPASWHSVHRAVTGCQNAAVIAWERVALH